MARARARARARAMARARDIGLANSPALDLISRSFMMFM